MEKDEQHKTYNFFGSGYCFDFNKRITFLSIKN